MGEELEKLLNFLVILSPNTKKKKGRKEGKEEEGNNHCLVSIK